MMYIRYKTATATFHVNEDTTGLRQTAALVIGVQADCDELEFIRDHFNNLPIPNNKRVVSWYGDLAKFIVANLP